MKTKKIKKGSIIAGVILLALLAVGFHYMTVTPEPYIECSSSADCPDTANYKGATLTDGFCYGGSCTYRKCIKNCDVKLPSGDDLCEWVDCEDSNNPTCGDGFCNGGETCADSIYQNQDNGPCFADCGRCGCIEGAIKSRTCKSERERVWVVCRNGKWIEDIEECKSDEECINGRCREITNVACRSHHDCDDKIIEPKHCKGNDVVITKRKGICVHPGMKYSYCTLGTKEDYLVKHCKNACKDGECITFPSGIECGQIICVQRNAAGRCISWVIITSICLDNQRLYKCNTEEIINCVERGYEGCSMQFGDATVNGHCVGEGLRPTTTIQPTPITTLPTPTTLITTTTISPSEECTTDEECKDKYESCHYVCAYGACVATSSNLQPPCEGAEFIGYPTCDWDVSGCETPKCGENEVLKNDRCVCKEGYKRAGDTCIPQHYCSNNKILVNGKCVCKSDMFEFNGECYPDTYLYIAFGFVISLTVFGILYLQKPRKMS